MITHLDDFFLPLQVWDEGLGAEAQSFSERCGFSFDRASIQGYDRVERSFAIVDPSAELIDVISRAVIDVWVDRGHKFYDYDTNTCSAHGTECHAYTQV